AGHVLRLPAGRKVVVPVLGLGAPPETGVDGRATAKEAASHLVGVAASNAGRINPDLVAEAGDVEAGEIGALEPLGLPLASPLAGRDGALLDQQDAVASLAEPIGKG